MDANKFDELVARLGDGASRRDTVKGIVGGALAAVGVTSVAAAKNGKAKGQGEDDLDAEKKKKKCRKKGDKCSVANRKKCCSKFCNGQGRCAKKPVS